ncbi:FKBP-type peptidyl-prolyl cis-trans isomerase [Candidatus Woesearchaeota archaeon]|nr:FKBP-type peptidyl-prolyl cis-trans isomerase [Candidatus Woesearchaeota archaeon]
MDGKDKDEDLDIDLKNIWPFRKKEKPKAEQTHHSKDPSKADQETEQQHSPEHHKDEEDSEIDLRQLWAKTKSAFRETAKKPAEKTEDEVALDVSSIASFYNRHSDKILPLIGIILLVIVSTYIRMLPAQMTYTEDWGRQVMHGEIRNDLDNAISQQYPNLPQDRKDALIGQGLDKAIRTNKYKFETGQYAGAEIDVKQQTKLAADKFKTFFMDSKNNPYMPDIDPYYWYRYAKNIVEHGYPGDILKDGKSYDTFQLAPNGRLIEPEDTFHPYSIAYLYFILSAISPSITLMGAEMLYPVIIAGITAALVFLIARRIAGNVAGLFAGLMMAINPAFMTRTLYGHGDSDTWVVFFSVLAAYLYLEALEAKQTRNKLILGALAGATIGLYARFWGGWWFIFDIIIAVTALYTGYLAVANRNEVMRNFKGFIRKQETTTTLTVFLAFLLTSAVTVSLLSNFETFATGPIGSIGFTRIKQPVTESLWPNVLTTVAELNEGDINGILNNAGGLFLFYIALLGVGITIVKKRVDTTEMLYIAAAAVYWFVLLLLRNNFQQQPFILLLAAPIVLRVAYAALKSEPIDMKPATMLIIWFIITIYASTKGIRFVLLLAPAFSIGFGTTIGFLYRHISHILVREMHLNRLLANTSLIIVAAMLFITPTNVWGISTAAARGDVPMINDAWYNALAAIRDNSNKTAIITSWWDFGHHFKALAERPVTFDGTTQGSPQAHWVGQILRTDNEELAVGILRMLDCGGNNAFDELQKTNTADTITSVKTLYDIFEENRDTAKRTLTRKYGISEEQAENVLRYTHCEPPEAFFIASEDMIGKSGVWAHFGSWNFEKAYIWQRLRNKPHQEAIEDMQKKFNYTMEQAEQTYDEMIAIPTDSDANTWVAPWPNYAQMDSCQREKGNTATCNNGMRINLTNQDVWFYNQQNEIRHPKGVVFVTETGIETKTYEQQDVGVGATATVIPEGNNYRLIMAVPELNASMFTKMFFMEGHTLRHFKLLTTQTSVTGAKIYVYKVDWKGGQPHINEEYRKKPEPQPEQQQQQQPTQKIEKTKASPGDNITFNYIGFLETGQVFDSSIIGWENKNTTKDTALGEDSAPLTFTAGSLQIIPGLEEQMLGMNKGEEKTIQVPPEKAYGTDPEKHPLGNRTLYFKVRIEDIR